MPAHSKLTPELAEEFCQKLKENGILGTTARLCGVTPRAVQRGGNSAA